jgi:hypothetical protein
VRKHAASPFFEEFPMKPIVLLTTALIVAAAGVPVLAQGGPAGKHGRLVALDTNKDGAIDRAEAAKAPKLLERFDQLDANKDGRISAEERPQRGRHGRKEGPAKLDTDGDQRVSRQEAGARPQLAERFTAIDDNNDGYLTREELQSYRREHGKRPQAPSKP